VHHNGNWSTDWITGPDHREVYLTDPDTVPEEELLTELQVPIDRETCRAVH